MTSNVSLAHAEVASMRPSWLATGSHRIPTPPGPTWESSRGSVASEVPLAIRRRLPTASPLFALPLGTSAWSSSLKSPKSESSSSSASPWSRLVVSRANGVVVKPGAISTPKDSTPPRETSAPLPITTPSQSSASVTLAFAPTTTPAHRFELRTTAPFPMTQCGPTTLLITCAPDSTTTPAPSMVPSEITPLRSTRTPSSRYRKPRSNE
mmetsp:Transcript_18525/g.53212  ORF Transcript_18525/g.53212 Transcript_18525/m.53212 type:complete len:209 (+) Transcript_18525:867-1493(+)